MLKFFYLLDPYQIFSVIAGIVFLINLAIIWFIKKINRFFKDIPGRLLVLLSAVTCSFVVIPLLLIFTALKQNNDGFFQQLFTHYFDAIFNLLAPLFKSEWFDGQFTGVIPTAIGLTIAFIPVLLLFGAGVLLIFKQVNPRHRLILFLASLAAGFCNTLLIGLFVVSFLGSTNPIQQMCSDRVRGVENFKQHVEDLCNQRTDKRECPKNEGELRAFNPHNYDLMKTCTDSYYLYSEKYGQLWVVKYPFGDYLIYSRSSKIPMAIGGGQLDEAQVKQLRQIYESK